MNRFQKWLPALFVALVILLIGVGVFSWVRNQEMAEEPTEVASVTPSGQPSSTEIGSPTPLPSGSPLAGASGAAVGSPLPSGSPLAVVAAPATTASNGKADLTVDANGMSKTTVVMTTTEGVVKFKLYPQDAPNTVNRFIELAQKGFYNGLTFHRAIENFIVQTGDPTGSGTGGSGQKLKAEFNNRHHSEGAIAMARAPSDPDSADSQFYITLRPQPSLDHNYTVFGQVIEGMDAVRKIKVGDKITSITLQ